jgi:hypothetical protein
VDFDDHRQVWKVLMRASDDGARYVNRFLEAAAPAENWKFYTPLIFYGTNFTKLIKEKYTFDVLLKLCLAIIQIFLLFIMNLAAYLRRKKISQRH